MTANSRRSSNASIKLSRQKVALAPNPHLGISSKRNPLHLQAPNKPLLTR
ncbi:hypothetical protein HID58_083594 [Brassica napus]|uniref:Uncharacterized protein n=1 Tax=Brassica napus TaxID=3708 RepID=A0ABQ7YGE6_BRANA|nr:hypothetical protein HID58_083594 [Brassica napus]